MSDRQLVELKCMKKLLNPSTPQPRVVQEQREVPELEHILGAMASKLPKQNLPSSEICSLISNVFSNLVKAHSAQAQAAKGLADLATAVMPEQMTLILAATVPLTVQLSLPTGTILPLSIPPAPPTTMTTCEGRHDIKMFCKSKILPDPKHKDLLKHEKKSPTCVLAAALYAVLERKSFEERMSRSDIASMFSITTAQLMKAVTGVDYESRPKMKRKRKTDADSTTPSKVAKTSTESTPSTSQRASATTTTVATKPVQGQNVSESKRHTVSQDKATTTQHQTEQEDMLTSSSSSSSSSSSDSESLPKVPFNM